MEPSKSSILAINGGSSSVKFALYITGEPLEKTLRGQIDWIELSGTGRCDAFLSGGRIYHCHQRTGRPTMTVK